MPVAMNTPADITTRHGASELSDGVTRRGGKHVGEVPKYISCACMQIVLQTVLVWRGAAQ